MVSKPAYKRKTVTYTLRIMGGLLLMVAVAIFVFLVLTSQNAGDGRVANNNNDSEVIDTQTEEEPEEEPVVVLSDKVDFQPTVDKWVASTGGSKSVLIYDLERDELVGSYNTAESYNTASLYKLFVVYEGYRRVQNGEWDKSIVAGSTGYTIEKCLDLAIRESYSPCAETLWGMIGHDKLDQIIEEDFKITNSDISSLISNPEDIMKIMKLFYMHPDVTDENLIALMKDSFLNQPATEYNWRQGLPSGFTKANVYNKVGWDWNGKSWNLYHDTAIVEYPEDGRHFIVVVMTSQVPYQKIRDFGNMFEATYLEARS